MRYRLAFAALCFSVVSFLAVPASGAQIAACTPSFSACQIPENILLQLPFGAIAGDVILTEPGLTTVSDVFRIFNNIIDTGAGTGLGNMVFLYSADDSTPLPNPSTYSANAVSILEDPSGFTHYLGNGTDYLLNAPEPSTFGFLGLSMVAVVLQSRKRLRLLERRWRDANPGASA